jgi:hypothetical protein
MELGKLVAEGCDPSRGAGAGTDGRNLASLGSPIDDAPCQTLMPGLSVH